MLIICVPLIEIRAWIQRTFCLFTAWHAWYHVSGKREKKILIKYSAWLIIPLYKIHRQRTIKGDHKIIMMIIADCISSHRAHYLPIKFGKGTKKVGPSSSCLFLSLWTDGREVKCRRRLAKALKKCLECASVSRACWGFRERDKRKREKRGPRNPKSILQPSSLGTKKNGRGKNLVDAWL